MWRAFVCILFETLIIANKVHIMLLLLLYIRSVLYMGLSNEAATNHKSMYLATVTACEGEPDFARTEQNALAVSGSWIKVEFRNSLPNSKLGEFT
jgi:hypothetical protein